MSVSVLFGGHTDVGKRRANNEDAYRTELLAAGVPQPSALLVLSDGVGGANAGEVASRIVVDGVCEMLANHVQAVPVSTDRRLVLEDTMRELDRRVRAASDAPGRAGMGATVSILWVEAGQAWWGQAGDSRIYRLRKGVLEQVSHDHSPVGRLKAQGKLTEEQARVHPLRNLIDQCLGGGGAPVEPEVGHFAAELGDVYLLCSDGLSDGLWDRDLAVGLRLVAAGKQTPEVAAMALVNQAKDASGKDNITAIVAQVAMDLDGPSEVARMGGIMRVWRGFFSGNQSPR
jgi:protein phosphatase